MKANVFIVVIIVFVVLLGFAGQRLLNTQFTEPEPSMSISQIKSAAVQVPYDSLFRYNERYVGAIIYFRGQVVQVVATAGSDSYWLRVATKQPTYGNSWYEDIILVHYTGPRVLENDMVQVWGRVVGL